MFVISRHPPAPSLHLTGAGLARARADRVNLFPLPRDRECCLEVIEAAQGGFDIVMTADGQTPVEIARYPSRRLARRALARANGGRDAGWVPGLGRAAAAALLLFVAWFLFVVPGEMPALAALEAPAAPRANPTAAPPPDAPPAFVDDPARFAPAPRPDPPPPDNILNALGR